MARTKQTARRSTGGKAPRKRLASVSCTWDRSPRYYSYSKLSVRCPSTSADITPSETLPVICADADSAAQRAVLSTPDLLIIILSQLPHSSLLKAQRVNRTWASLFDHVEIQAALFKKPRPNQSAAYVEIYSDILRDQFEAFWPIPGEDRVRFSMDSKTQRFHPEGWCKISASPFSDPNDRNTIIERRYEEVCPYRKEWGQLLVCQPSIEILELVRKYNTDDSEMVEYRSLIHRPNGLRMGLLYDAVTHWHALDPAASLLWGRKTGDLVDSNYFYIDGSSFKTGDDKPCLTMWGTEWTPKHGDEVIRSDGEEVRCSISAPKAFFSEEW
ncbi:hypothetical protein PWT90_06707 [Aphanocladium album]|nr:hypothetical protein PWT90_06707 [Aphanocladium album]